MDDEEFTVAENEVEERISEGDYVGARQVATALRRRIEALNGLHTPMWGKACFLEARTSLALGDYPLALEQLRAAVEIEGDDDETTQTRLTHAMTLGDVLSELGRLEEAEAVQRTALDQRRAFYGEDHPGFGYGAESLGTVLLRKGDFDEAVELGKAAVTAFRQTQPHKLQAALLLWMLAEKSRDPLAHVLGLLDDGDRANLIGAIARAPSYLFVEATLDLRWEILEHIEDLDARAACLATMTNLARALGRDDDRIRASQQYAQLMGQSSDEGA